MPATSKTDNRAVAANCVAACAACARHGSGDATKAPLRLARGTVVHARLRPTPHKLRYRMTSIHLDLDALSDAAASCRLFSVNRVNVFAFHERDHGFGDARPLALQIRQLLRARVPDIASDLADGIDGLRLHVLCYPRVLNYVFNPLTVYFAQDAHGTLRAIVYEVNNTFGQRHFYVAPVSPAAPAAVGAHQNARQNAEKCFYVSPFNSQTGRYRFHVTLGDDRVVIGILLDDDRGPMFKAHFAGMLAPASDARLARLFAIDPVMTVKAYAGIHIEAARLWMKGLRLVKRPEAPSHGVSRAQTVEAALPLATTPIATALPIARDPTRP